MSYIYILYRCEGGEDRELAFFWKRVLTDFNRAMGFRARAYGNYLIIRVFGLTMVFLLRKLTVRNDIIF